MGDGRRGVTSLPALRVEVRGDRGAVVLALQGEADLATAPRLARALAQVSEDGTAHVVIDAARLEFIGACCLDLIANARARLRDQGGDLSVRSPAPLFRQMLTILEMNELIERADDPALVMLESA
jgi:anti-sigma B factor antagonist